MFGTAHPRPPQRKEVAMQIVQQEQRAFDKTLTVDLPDGDVAPPPPVQAIRFEVAYTLEEYLSVLGEHVAFLLRHAGPAQRRRAVLWPLALGAAAAAAAWLAGPGWIGTTLALAGVVALCSLPFAAPFWVLAFGTPVFLFKKRRMPLCTFRIDQHGIERSSRTGTLAHSWADVRMVRRYGRAYLLLFARGALPIPLRCLDQGQQETLRRFMLAYCRS